MATATLSQFRNESVTDFSQPANRQDMEEALKKVRSQLGREYQLRIGGEWISTIEIENLAVGHPAVAEAAVIGIAHPKWDERPLLIVVLKPGAAADKESLLAHLRGRIAKWWLPDAVAFVDEIPHTATGKIRKTELRRRFADFKFAP